MKRFFWGILLLAAAVMLAVILGVRHQVDSGRSAGPGPRPGLRPAESASPSRVGPFGSLGDESSGRASESLRLQEISDPAVGGPAFGGISDLTGAAASVSQPSRREGGSSRGQRSSPSGTPVPAQPEARSGGPGAEMTESGAEMTEPGSAGRLYAMESDDKTKKFMISKMKFHETRMSAFSGLHKAWELKANSVQMFHNKERAYARQVRGSFYEEGKVKAICQAPRAEVNLKTKDITFLGDVYMEAASGEKVWTPALSWDGKRKRLMGSHGVKVLRGKDLMVGDSMEVDPSFKDLRIEGHVQVDMQRKEGKS